MIIVTGGAGFIGSNLVRGLNRRGTTDILVVDNLTRGDKHRTLNALEFADYLDKCDFLPRIADLIAPGVDGVFHLGACSDTMESDGRYLMDNNFAYSKALLHRCQEAGVPFIYASSASVYGDGARGFVEERRCEYPINAYAYSKFVFDQYVRRLGPTRTPITGLRYFNVYGPQENHKGRMATVVYQFHRQLSAGGRLELFEGSDGFRRDFIHVDDVVGVNLHFLERPASGIFNCGTGRAESFRAIAELMAPLYPSAEIGTKPFPEALKGKYQAYTCADLTRLRAAGFVGDFTSLADGVRSYVALLKDNDGHYRTAAAAGSAP